MRFSFLDDSPPYSRGDKIDFWKFEPILDEEQAQRARSLQEQAIKSFKDILNQKGKKFLYPCERGIIA